MCPVRIQTLESHFHCFLCIMSLLSNKLLLLYLQSRRAETVSEDTGLKVRGNRPYKIPGKVPVYPKGDRKCSGCKACAKVCPAGAIDPSNPKKTDTSKCISCGRCVVVCPEHSRRFRGLLYKIAENKFLKAYSGRKEPDTYYCNR